jgi:hypothetical protein
MDSMFSILQSAGWLPEIACLVIVMVLHSTEQGMFSLKQGSEGGQHEGLVLISEEKRSQSSGSNSNSSSSLMLPLDPEFHFRFLKELSQFILKPTFVRLSFSVASFVIDTFRLLIDEFAHIPPEWIIPLMEDVLMAVLYHLNEEEEEEKQQHQQQQQHQH